MANTIQPSDQTWNHMAEVGGGVKILLNIDRVLRSEDMALLDKAA